MAVRIDIGSLRIREVPDQKDLFEVSVDATEGTALNDWENTWNPVSALANRNEPVAEILKRLRAEYVKRCKQSVAGEAMHAAIRAALEKDVNAQVFTRQDPDPPKAAPMEVKIVTELK